jgi:hypothetical protein
MGTEQSKPVETALVKTTNNIIELYQQNLDELWAHNKVMLQYISVLENKEKIGKLLSKPIQGHLFLTKREDGSSVKELLITDWDVVFFLNGGKLDLRLNNLQLKCEDNAFSISDSNAEALHNAYINWRESECTKCSALSVLNTYLRNSSNNKL